MIDRFVAIYIWLGILSLAVLFLSYSVWMPFEEIDVRSSRPLPFPLWKSLERPDDVVLNYSPTTSGVWQKRRIIYPEN